MISFQIGAWSYTHNSGMLKSGQFERVLEPLIENLFVYFIENHGRVISRQELVENVWKLNFVDDNSINRAISELRKQLKLPSSNQTYIKTHYRKGYSLTFTPEAKAQHETVSNPIQFNPTETKERLNTEQTAPNQFSQLNSISSHPFSIKKLLLLIIPIALLLALYTAQTITFGTDNKNNDTSPVKANGLSSSGLNLGQSSLQITKKIKHTSVPASWLKGSEYWPALSPNKQLFSFINEKNGIKHSYVSSLNDDTTVPVVHENYQSMAVSWQHNTNKLLVKLVGGPNDECYWALFEVEGFPKVQFERFVMSCRNLGLSYAQMSPDGQGLYFANREEGTFNISYWDIEQNKSTIIIPSYGEYLGIRQFEISPNGEQIVYQREVQAQPAKVFIYNIKTMESQKVYEFPFDSFVRNVKWFGDDMSLIWNDKNSIKWLNLENKVATRLQFIDKNQLTHLAVINKGQSLTVEESSPENQIKIFDFAFNVLEDEALMSDGTNRFPRFIDNGLIFISNRSGANQYWYFEDQLTRLTDYTNEESRLIFPPSAAKDGSLYVFHHQNEINLADSITGDRKVVPFPKNHFINSAVLGPNNRFIYSVSTVDKRIQLWRYDLLTDSLEQVEAKDPKQLLTAPDGHVYYTNSNSLVGLTKPLNLKLELNLNLYLDVMSMSNNYFYVYYQSLDTIYQIDLETGNITKIGVPIKLSSISVNSDDTKIAASTAIERNTQVKRTDWQVVSEIELQQK